ncbi:TRM11 family SAM-dependent methyltransferase [Clostridium sp. LP20]|uniref:TRM11 family SAM-dependent methyltransferase n=1 Tax=Clostridium sp. LP20 TaxID=3418665 RepID=UPI003EE54C10
MGDVNLNSSEIISKEYFYAINYPTFEENLCDMEMKYLFNKVPAGKYFLSDKYINPSRSPFIKESISIIYSEESLEKIIQNIVEDKLAYDDFKVCYIKVEGGDVDYKERLRSLREIGWVIQGEPDMHEPKVTLGVTKFEGKWIFGIYERNDYEWHIHDEKPFSYSNSLSLRVSRAVVNIAVGNNLGCRLVDPCCGVGTVVLEALSMGINVRGYEINDNIAGNAIRNLEFFGYENVIENKDMHRVEEHYDVAIVDLPYGLFSPTTIKEQTDIMKTARKIADKLVIITFEEMDKHIREAGFEIIDNCYVCKGKFKRYINICK